MTEIDAGVRAHDAAACSSLAFCSPALALAAYPWVVGQFLGREIGTWRVYDAWPAIGRRRRR